MSSIRAESRGLIWRRCSGRFPLRCSAGSLCRGSRCNAKIANGRHRCAVVDLKLGPVECRCRRDYPPASFHVPDVRVGWDTCAAQGLSGKWPCADSRCMQVQDEAPEQHANRAAQHNGAGIFLPPCVIKHWPKRQDRRTGKSARANGSECPPVKCRHR